MKKHFKTAMKHLLLWLVVGVGFFLFLMIAGEEDPANPMTLSQFCMLKFGAMAGLCLVVVFGKALYRAGLFPDNIYKELEEEEL